MSSAQITFNEAVAILTERIPADTWAATSLSGNPRQPHASRTEDLPHDMEVAGSAVARFLKEAVERGLCRCRGLLKSRAVRRKIKPARMHDLEIWPGVGKPDSSDGQPEAIAIAKAYVTSVGAPPDGDHRYESLRFFEDEIQRLRHVFETWHTCHGDWNATVTLETGDTESASVSAKPSSSRRRRRDPGAADDYERKRKLLWAEVKRRWPDRKKRPSAREMARELCSENGRERWTKYALETVRKILMKPSPD